MAASSTPAAVVQRFVQSGAQLVTVVVDQDVAHQWCPRCRPRRLDRGGQQHKGEQHHQRQPRHGHRCEQRCAQQVRGHEQPATR